MTGINPEERMTMIHKYYHQKDFTGWFDVLYGRADGQAEAIPWAKLEPNPLMIEWLKPEKVDCIGKRAIVVGCGLGDDAEALAHLGFDVTAFDIAPNAIAWCKRRFPNSQVNYQVIDLFDMPTEWKKGFDFVFEALTIQSLPLILREKICRSVANLVAAGGELLVICFARDDHEPIPHVPFPISKEELQTLVANGLKEERLEDFIDPVSGLRRFRIWYTRGVDKKLRSDELA